MAPKRKSAPAPPPPQEHSSTDEDSSSEEEFQEETVPPPVSAQAKTKTKTKTKFPTKAAVVSESDSEFDSEPEPPAKPTFVPPAKTPTMVDEETETDESESESESEFEPDPPAKPEALAGRKAPAKPIVYKPPESSEEEDSDEEDDEEEPEKVEKPMPAVKPPMKIAESEPQKKKVKLAEKPSPSKNSASIITRVWSPEDEMVLLRALAEYYDKNGKLPPTKDYGHLLATISGSIGFPVTEKQIVNKIRMIRDNYTKKKKKGTYLKITKPHEKAVFDISAKLFEENNKPVNKEAKAAKEAVEINNGTDSDSDEEVGAGVGAGEANGGAAHSGAASGHDGARSNHYLRSLIEDLVKERHLSTWFTVEDAVARIGKSGVKNWETRIKLHRIETLKLHAKEESLKAELFSTIAEGME